MFYSFMRLEETFESIDAVRCLWRERVLLVYVKTPSTFLLVCMYGHKGS